MSKVDSKALDSVLAKWTDQSKNHKDILPFANAGLTDANEILYLGSAGLKDITEPDSKVSNDTTFALYSTTKAVVITALFQLIERGKIDSIDDLVEKYVPDMKKIKVIKGFDGDKPILVDPKTKVTLKHLITHTAGFSYAFFNPAYAKLQKDTGSPNILKAEWDHFTAPLTFEPGSRWEYGSNIDWVGKVIAEVSGETLHNFVKTNICNPLGIETFTFRRTEKDLENQAKIHFRNLETGELTPSGELHPLDPAFQCGGHGLFGTVRNYLKFLQIFLNQGSAHGVQILKPETVNNFFLKDLLVDDLSGVHLETLPGAQPQLSHDVTFPPNSSWTAAFNITHDPLPTGRSAGSVNWGGLTNIYYWVDVKKGVAGYFATQVFPFYDPVALQAFSEFEKTSYDSLEKR